MGAQPSTPSHTADLPLILPKRVPPRQTAPIFLLPEEVLGVIFEFATTAITISLTGRPDLGNPIILLIVCVDSTLR